MKREYKAAIAILLRKNLGEKLSDEESTTICTLLESDSDFKTLADRIIQEDYLATISNYHQTNVEERIRHNIEKRITEIKHKQIAKRRRNLATISVAAAMMTVIITIGLRWTNPKQELPTAEHLTQMVENDFKDVVLITDKGDNIKLSGTTYSVAKKEVTVKSPTAMNAMATQTTLATVVVPMKKEFTIILPDGTKVWLNSGTKLTFPNEFQGNERVVEIDGEGYFEVTHNAEKPFIVRNPVMETRVLGTKFLVSAYPDNNSQSVSLVEGSVEVSSSISDFKSMLAPGRGVIFNSNNHTFTNIEVNIENIISKVDGMLVFENESLQTICSALMRKYGISYQIMDKKLEKKLFYMRTKKYDSIESVMELLKAAAGINYKIEENRLTIYQ